jgi:hypothetical protein
MNRKKSVIFYISNNKQYYCEFHENTKLRMIKSYIKDVGHIDNFQLITNGEILKNDEIAIKEIISHHNKNDLVIKVVQTSTAINEFTEECLKENSMLRSEIAELNKHMETLYEENSIYV